MLNRKVPVGLPSPSPKQLGPQSLHSGVAYLHQCRSVSLALQYMQLTELVPLANFTSGIGAAIAVGNWSVMTARLWMAQIFACASLGPSPVGKSQSVL
jgi:hypothetical protein